jgi:lipid A ethanolaminephosphotransferase
MKRLGVRDGFPVRTLLGLLFIAVFTFLGPSSLSQRVHIQLSYGDVWYQAALNVTVTVVATCLVFLMLACAAWSRPRIKWPVFIMVAISFTAMDVYRRSSGKVMEYADWLVLWQGRANAGDAAAEYGHLMLAVLPWMGVVLLGFLCVRGRSRSMTSLVAVVLLTVSVGLFTGVCVVKRGGATNKLPMATGLYGLVAAQLLDGAGSHYAYTTDAKPARAPSVTHIVLVIDESVRQGFFERVIAPELRARSAGSGWNVYDFGLATSVANCSAPSNIMLRKGVRFDHITQDLHRDPLLWSLAHNAGFSTWLLDAQIRGRGGNYFDDHERSLIDHLPEVRSKQDADIVTVMASYLSEDASSFTIVNKQGAHFPYPDHFPDGYESPFLRGAPSYVKDSVKRINYVNALDYQTGGFFDQLLKTHVAQPTLVIYTSDHGQNVGDRPGLHHCNVSLLPSEDEGMVPLVILTNTPVPGMEGIVADVQNRLSDFDIAPLIRAAMGYGEMSWVDRLRQPSGANGFVYGSTFGYFGSPVTIRHVDRQAYAAMIRQRWAK